MDSKEIEKKWQQQWEEAKLFEANPDPAKKKYFVTFPYPYMNGYMHIGHSYTLMRVEAMARFKRMQGYNVLFPQGWHCTGSPITSAAQRIAEGEEKQIKIMKDMGFSDAEIKKFAKPEHWAEFFPNEAKKDMKRFGISIDFRREFITTSLNPHYDRFIRWQFNKLKARGYVVKGRHPVVWCPKEGKPIGDHDRAEGEGETPQEFVLLKFKFGNEYLVAATLRPETVFGQTNLWVGPDNTYVKAKVNNEVWIISKEAADKLKEQERTVQVIGEVKGKDLLGKKAVAPAIERELPILPSGFCDPTKGTGIVTSVPSDAPDDWMGLHDLQNDPKMAGKYGLDLEEIKKIKPIPIIDSEDLGDLAAITITERMEIKNQFERDKLEEAKRIVYKKGYYGGIMKAVAGKYGGMKVETAKELVKEELIKQGKAELFYELTGRVVCRDLTPAVVKIVSDQWFIKYGDKEWKDKARECLKSMKLYPDASRLQFEYTIGWLNDWPCAHESGLGTKLPWDERWVVESLSDSTIYMAYYTIAHKIKQLDPSNLDDAFFDYVFLGVGNGSNLKVPKVEADAMKKEFEYWYPVDFRNSGKDLVQNHLTFFIFNHTAIFPQKHWPAGIGVNGWILVEGEKMSKSKGNFYLLREITDKFGADPSRITILSGGEGLDDPNWRSEFAENIKARLDNLSEFCINNYGKGTDEIKPADGWMDSVLNSTITSATECMEKTAFRSALQSCFFDLQNSVRWYMGRTSGKPNKKTVSRIIETQLLLLAPFAPHTCEEIWHGVGKKTFISAENWPAAGAVDEKVIALEGEVKKLIEDLNNLLRIIKDKKTKAFIYAIADDEASHLSDASQFIAERVGFESVMVFSVKDKGKYDPQGKSAKAKPGKPAIYLE